MFLLCFLVLFFYDGSCSSSKRNIDWPCPLEEDIFPCTCTSKFTQRSTNSIDYCFTLGDLNLYCDNVVELHEIQRIFSQNFPFPNLSNQMAKAKFVWYNQNLLLDSIVLSAQDQYVWESSIPISLPVDVFNGKSAKDIWIDIKLDFVDPQAFLSSHSRLEFLEIGGPGMVDARNTLQRLTKN